MKKDYINLVQTTNLNNKEIKAIINQLSVPLLSLAKRNENINHINYKIHYLLCDPFTYVNAYAKKSFGCKGALTKGIAKDEELIRFFDYKNAVKIANKFKTNSFWLRPYKWTPTRRIWIPELFY